MSNFILDSHSHIQFPNFDKDLDATVERAKSARVKIIVSGVNLLTSQAAIDLAKQYPEEIWATVGCHPEDATDFNENDIKEIFELAKNYQVVGIGECGLDYFRLTGHIEQTKNTQKNIFLKQVEIAQQLKKSIIIHARPSKGTQDAYEDILNFLDKDIVKNIGVVMHFFAGSLDTVKKMTERGYYFTFGGVVTFSRDYDEIIRYLPMNRILIETDAPFVAPVPYRGKRNEPAYILEVVKKIAEIRNVSMEEIIEILAKNAKSVFRLTI